MRRFREPSCKNFLRAPLVMGVSQSGLLLLTLIVATLQLGSGFWGRTWDFISLGVAVVGYALLRIAAHFSTVGSEEGAIFWLEERLGRRRLLKSSFDETHLKLSILHPDTATERDLIQNKLDLKSELKGHGTLVFRKDSKGVAAFSVHGQSSGVKFEQTAEPSWHTYSLIDLPAGTDPMFLFSMLSKLTGHWSLYCRHELIPDKKIKRRLEAARRRNSIQSRTASLEGEVSFEEASSVLEGIIRGNDECYQVSIVLLTELKHELPEFFLKEKTRELPLRSVLGFRRRWHRALTLRADTLCDFLPTVFDAAEPMSSTLTSTRGNPVYFDPQDSRLEALHWLVVGASGSGKSFFTGLILKRLIESKVPMSVLFVDHGRSFKRLIKGSKGEFIEGETLSDIESSFTGMISSLAAPGQFAGVELSDLSLQHKQLATKKLLLEIERFLKQRRSSHPIYVVFDECWNFMRHSPDLIQRAFREYRKLNGAVIAITQSLGDFLSDESGQSIFQNAPIRVLLRQGEDITIHKERLGLNDVEIMRARYLNQKKGEYSELIVKTPFLSRLGRLYPTALEHQILRTDNLREELMRERCHA